MAFNWEWRVRHTDNNYNIILIFYFHIHWFSPVLPKGIPIAEIIKKYTNIR